MVRTRGFEVADENNDTNCRHRELTFKLFHQQISKVLCNFRTKIINFPNNNKQRSFTECITQYRTMKFYIDFEEFSVVWKLFDIETIFSQ